MPTLSIYLVALLATTTSARRDENAESPSCAEVASLARGVPGAFVPSCEEDGSYSSKQCHGSTGHCWCSTKLGEEIIGTRRGPVEDRMDCSNIPECLMRAHEAQSRRMHGTYVPQCEVDGSYKLEQCHHSTGYCWCVSNSGFEITGTRRGPAGTAAAGRVDCWNLPKCLKMAHDAKQRHGLGVYVPQCEADGSFSSQQCHGSTGHCWCVRSDEGVEITGTRRTASQEKVECGERVPLCLRMAHEARSLGLVGTYIPQCDEETGRFTAQQCHGSTGHCWCVAAEASVLSTSTPSTPSTSTSTSSSSPFLGEGVEIIGTRSGPSETRMDCNSIPQCLIASHRARIISSSRRSSSSDDNNNNLGTLIGAFIPQCELDGSFSTRQCHGSTGYCWCVSREDGHEITGTRRRPSSSSSALDCNNVPACLVQADTAMSHMMPGTFVPQCNEEDGSFQARQCHSSTGHCWCVDEQGRKIVGSVRSPVQVPLTCQGDVPECVLAVHQATVVRKPMIGSFTPQCEEDGSFSSKQCHGSTGFCWCVDERGREIQGTRARGGGAVKCGNELPECLRQAHSARNSHRGTAGAAGEEERASSSSSSSSSSPSSSFIMFGLYIPQCEVDGSFSSTQCHGSTGHCWCVDENGVELLGSRRTASETRPDCSKTPLSDCQVEARRAESMHLLGMFVPSCESDGSYSKRQCHGSTGHCWCVDESGDEILGTRSTPQHTTQIVNDCANLHSCLLTAHNRRHQGSLMGAYIPQCDSQNGSYSTIQCHTSTATCWCSTHDGQEIPDTRVRFHMPQCPQ